MLAIVILGLFWHQAHSARAAAVDFQCHAECSAEEALGRLDALQASSARLQLDQANLERDALALQELLVVAREGCVEASSRTKRFSAGGATDSDDRSKVQRVIRSGSTKSSAANSQASCPEVLVLEAKVQMTVAALDVRRRDLEALDNEQTRLQRYLAAVVEAESKAAAKSAAPSAEVAAVNNPVSAANLAAQSPDNQSSGAVPVQALTNPDPVGPPDPGPLPVTANLALEASSPAVASSLATLRLVRQSRWLEQGSVCTDSLPRHVAYPVY